MSWMVQKTNWLGLALRIKNGATYAFLLLLLAAPVTVMGSKWNSNGLLQVSKGITVLVVLLELAIAATGTWLTYRVRRYWAWLRRRDASDPHVQQLRGSLRKAVSLACSTWLLAVSTVCLPLIMDMVARLPELGLLFVPFILLLGMQWFNTRTYSELAMTVATDTYMPANTVNGV